MRNLFAFIITLLNGVVLAAVIVPVDRAFGELGWDVVALVAALFLLVPPNALAWSRFERRQQACTASPHEHQP